MCLTASLSIPLAEIGQALSALAKLLCSDHLRISVDVPQTVVANRLVRSYESENMEEQFAL
jgi:hypothetical protein